MARGDAAIHPLSLLKQTAAVSHLLGRQHIGYSDKHETFEARRRTDSRGASLYHIRTRKLTRNERDGPRIARCAAQFVDTA